MFRQHQRIAILGDLPNNYASNFCVFCGVKNKQKFRFAPF